MKKAIKDKHKGVRVLLVGAEDEENLSIRYLAAVLEKEGHEAEIVPCSSISHYKKVLASVSNYGPEIIGISIAFQCISGIFFDLVRLVRKNGYKGHIVVGGHFPTFEYMKILETNPGIDSVGRFEGEKTMVELANHLSGDRQLSKVANLVYRTPEGTFHENPCLYRFPVLDELPYPKRTDKPQKRLGEKFATLAASRGCWHSSCLYCCIGAFHSKKEGKKFDLRSPVNVAEEIGSLYREKGVRLFQFHDDNYMLPSKEETIDRINSLKKAIHEKGIDTRDIAFLIKARPDTVDLKVASALKEMGTVGVFLGVENASQTGLKALIRGSDLEDIETAVTAFRETGIITTYNLLIFHPAATLDEINQNILFAKENIDLPFDFGRAEIVAGSPLERMLVKDGGLRGRWPNWNYEIKDALVEKMFKINCLTFRRKESPYSRLAESTIAMAYHAYALKRLHKGPAADRLAGEARDLTKDINRFILKEMMEMYDLTLRKTEEEDINKLYNEIATGCDRRLASMKKTTDRMLRLQAIEGIFDMLGVKESAQDTRLNPLLRF